jgi:hypothetical protein
MELIRFISQQEYNALMTTGKVTPKNMGRAWSGKKRIFTFPLGPYSLKEYIAVKEYLEVAYDIDYDYMVTIKPTGYAYETFAAYDKEMMDMTLGKELSFDIDEDMYDSGAVYVIPEVLLDSYTREEVIRIKPLNDIQESTKLTDKHNAEMKYAKDLLPGDYINGAAITQVEALKNHRYLVSIEDQYGIHDIQLEGTHPFIVYKYQVANEAAIRDGDLERKGEGHWMVENLLWEMYESIADLPFSSVKDYLIEMFKELSPDERYEYYMTLMDNQELIEDLAADLREVFKAVNENKELDKIKIIAEGARNWSLSEDGLPTYYGYTYDEIEYLIQNEYSELLGEDEDDWDHALEVMDEEYGYVAAVSDLRDFKDDVQMVKDKVKHYYIGLLKSLVRQVYITSHRYSVDFVQLETELDSLEYYDKIEIEVAPGYYQGFTIVASTDFEEVDRDIDPVIRKYVELIRNKTKRKLIIALAQFAKQWGLKKL